MLLCGYTCSSFWERRLRLVYDWIHILSFLLDASSRDPTTIPPNGSAAHGFTPTPYATYAPRHDAASTTDPANAWASTPGTGNAHSWPFFFSSCPPASQMHTTGLSLCSQMPAMVPPMLPGMIMPGVPAGPVPVSVSGGVSASAGQLFKVLEQDASSPSDSHSRSLLVCLDGNRRIRLWD